MIGYDGVIGMDVKVSVSDFIDLLNETYELGFPSIVVAGELANLRISRGQWVHFDLKDESSSLPCFGVTRQLPGPLEDGMLLEVRGMPRMHNQYGFSFSVQRLKVAGEGSLRRAAELLRAKLRAEGLFDEARKRVLPYPPRRIGLITSVQSAAYADFVKILGARWGGLGIDVADVQVQGETAEAQIVAAIQRFDVLAAPPQVLVMIRGGGSPDDLAVFSSEAVTRAVAASQVPTLVGIGHEIDVSLAELAADVRASTPSNAAELLVPDRRQVLEHLWGQTTYLGQLVGDVLDSTHDSVDAARDRLVEAVTRQLESAGEGLRSRIQLLAALNPEAILARGYAIVRGDRQAGGRIEIELSHSVLEARIDEIRNRKHSAGPMYKGFKEEKL